MNRIRIAYLKRRARQHHRRMEEIREAYDCGLALIREISPEFRRVERAYYHAIDTLRAIDPRFPQENA